MVASFTRHIFAIADSFSALPALHPGFGKLTKIVLLCTYVHLFLTYLLGIPTEFQGGNHTRAFTKSAASPEGHVACLNVSKTLAATGVRVLTDDGFFHEVSIAWEICDIASR